MAREIVFSDEINFARIFKMNNQITIIIGFDILDGGKWDEAKMITFTKEDATAFKDELDRLIKLLK